MPEGLYFNSGTEGRIYALITVTTQINARIAGLR